VKVCLIRRCLLPRAVLVPSGESSTPVVTSASRVQIRAPGVRIREAPDARLPRHSPRRPRRSAGARFSSSAPARNRPPFCPLIGWISSRPRRHAEDCENSPARCPVALIRNRPPHESPRPVRATSPSRARFHSARPRARAGSAARLARAIAALARRDRPGVSWRFSVSRSDPIVAGFRR